MSKTSLALNNLRAYAIFIILAYHSGNAYVRTQPAVAPPFDDPRYGWTVNPIVDSDRWLGFDMFSAFQFLYMMQLMFFLSGLFVWPSLQRKSAKIFLVDRFLRLGLPFALGAYVLMPWRIIRSIGSPRSIRHGRHFGRTGRHCRSGGPDRCGSCGNYWCSTSLPPASIALRPVRSDR